MKKYEGSWKNHIKEGQKKQVNDKSLETKTKEEVIVLKDIELDGLGIVRKPYKFNSIDEFIKELSREFACSKTSIKAP